MKLAAERRVRCLRTSASGAARVRPLMVAALAVAALCAACAPARREPLRIAVNVWPPYELFHLAQERGYFRDEGVEVELIGLPSYGGVLRSYHQGRIDGLLATLNDIQIKDNFRDPPAIVLALDYSSGGDALVARPGIPDVARLRGRRIACEESPLGSYVLERALASGGLSPRDVTVANRLPEESEVDLREGRVDAVVTYEPFLGRLERDSAARVLFSSRDMPGEILDVLAVRRSVLGERREDLRRLVRAWFRALEDLRDHPADAARIMAAREGVSPEEFLRALGTSTIPDRRENMRLIGTSLARGDLYRVADSLGEFLVRHGLARQAARGWETLDPSLLESL